jgi:hypothetical protein
MAYGFALADNPYDVYSLVLSVGTAPPPAAQTKLGPFLLRLPPAADADAGEDGSGAASGEGGSRAPRPPQFPPALWRALADPLGFAAAAAGAGARSAGVAGAAEAAGAGARRAAAAGERPNEERRHTPPLEVDGDDAAFVLDTLRPRLAKARILLEQHTRRAGSSSAAEKEADEEAVRQATYVGYYFSGQVNALLP